jgi:hypothetical protein
VNANAHFDAATLADWLAGELDEIQGRAVEEHFFDCEFCARRLESIERLTSGVAELVRRGRVATSVTRATLERATRDGLQLREYGIAAGGSVDCTAAPHDDYVVVHLEGPFPERDDLMLEVAAKDDAGHAFGDPFAMPVAVDRDGPDEVLLFFPGEVVRGYPRSRWTMHVVDGTGSRRGPFVMKHAPWGA